MTSSLPSAAAVRDALLAELERALAAMAEAARQTREGATHEENRSEGDKDMRSTEQSYLARGQAMRVEDLVEQVQRLRTFSLPAPGSPVVKPGVVLRVESDDESRVYLLVPYGGGTTVTVDGAEVTAITPSSPVGRAVMGKTTGDSFELGVRGKLREWSIEEIG